MRIDADSPVNALTAGALSQAARVGEVRPVPQVTRDDQSKPREGTRADPFINTTNSLVDSAGLLAVQEAASATPDQQQQGQGSKGGSGQPELSEEEQQIVAELKKRDQEVRQHEQAHAAAGGGLAGAPHYSYTRGPDGKQYATDGEVKIDVSPAPTPEGTIRKMETVIRAATAPIDPSSQDRAVAAQAKQAILEAQQEIQQQKVEEQQQQTGHNTINPADATSAIQSYQAVVDAISGLGASNNNRLPSLVA